MDSECVSVLPRVCKVLAASESSLPDDTSLEKLLDWFTALTKAGVSLLKDYPCLLEFVSTVFYNAAADPSILSFALKLTGLVASTDASFTVLQERSVLDRVFDPQHWREAGLWEDPCIRVGWIQGLRTMLEHDMALCFFVQAGFITPLLQLQTDTSLFVTAAASQMLAHVLLFSQSVPSVRCNGADKKKDKDDGVPRAFITDLEAAVTTETNQYSAPVAMVISEYLRKFLVPKDTSQYHQSQQILKLLALVLAQARPPLRKTLLLIVADTLEELVTKNCSQLTLPLMDVILVAHRSCSSDVRVPDQRADRLLSLMLNTGKPADLIHAAAAVLRSGHDGCVQRVQSARLLLLPLDIITGLTLLDTNSAGEHRFSMVEQLKSKTSCLSIICVSVTSTPQIILLGPDCLPCPPGLIVNAVLSILRMCIGDPLKTGCVDASRNVTNSGKVKKCALEALSALSCGPEVNVVLVEVLTLLIQYLDHPDSDPTVLQKSYQAFLKWISVCMDLLSETEQLRRDLMRVVRKRVCDMRWEVRDSTVEFLGQLAGVRASQMSADEACDASEILLGGCCFTTPLLKEGLQDPESYVRASSISALAQTLARSWHQGAELTHQQTEIVNRLLEILTQDTEGFARRAVVLFFITWFSTYASFSSSCSLLMPSVRAVLSQGSADLDWEVKVHTLDLAELLMDQAFSGYHGYTKGLESHPIQPHPYAVMDIQAYTLHTHTAAHMQDTKPGLVSASRRLVEQGVLSALLSGLVDCDRPVGLKACRLLIRLRDTICPLLSRVREATGTLGSDTRVCCELPRQGWAQEIINTLGMKMKSKEASASAQRRFHEADVLDSQDCDGAAEEGAGAGRHTVRVGVCEVLSSLALDERLDILTQSSDHIHNSPLSLLQDLLTASATHARSNSQADQEVIVDCY
ncbi:integrator complex assembly factor BRAT1 [Xenentodon cancila]